jgi:hypothetical protein
MTRTSTAALPDRAEVAYNVVMDRVIRFDDDDLEWSLKLSTQDRLRQANAAFRLYHALHRPFEKPFRHGFDALEDFFHFDEELRHPR